MPNIKIYFFVTIIFILTFIDIKSQSDDFITFANEFVNNVPISKEFFFNNSEEYLMYDELELNIINKKNSSDQYSWFKNYFDKFNLQIWC